MHFSLHSVIILLASSQAHAFQCFDDNQLKIAVNKYVEGTWTTSTTSPNAQTFGSIENWCTKDVTYMGFLFQGKATFNANITNWDVSSVTNMHAMFGGANAFNQDISGWNVSSVTNMRDMFNKAYAFDQDISPWNVSKVTDMWGMFYKATSFNEDISQWSVSKVTTMVNMFYGAEQFNQNLCAWKDENFPYQSAGGIFSLSGCTYKTNPVQETGTGPFCAVQDCSAPAPTQVPTSVPTPAPTNAPTSEPTESWALNYASLETNFNMNSTKEISLNYTIGKGRDHRVRLFKKGCMENITGTIVTSSPFISLNTADSSLENLEVLLDLDMNTIASSNIWDESTDSVVICVMIELLSGSNVIKTDARDVGINLDFGNNFTAIADANLDQTSIGSNTDSTKVENYIEACTCDNADSFTCNTNSLSPDDYLNVCVRSSSEEMEIDYLDNLIMTSNDDDTQQLVIVQNKALVDSTISSKTKALQKNGVHVASVIPSRFFSYSASSSAKVNGVVYLKLKGSRRRLAVELEITGPPGHPKVQATGSTRGLQTETESIGDQESAFAITVELRKNELGVAVDANDATDTSMSGFIAVLATAIGSAAAIMML